MNKPILITGCARSGTSMVAGIINMCGAYGGKMSGPNKNNKRGMFENGQIRNHVVKPYLRTLGVDPLGQCPLPVIADVQNNIPTDWAIKITNIIEQDGYIEGPWMYKGAKMCLFWPVWTTAFPDAKWIIVRRKTPDIINSCIKTGFMRAFYQPRNQKLVNVKNEYDGWLWWVRQHEQRFIEMIRSGINHRIIWPERFVEGDYAQIKEAIDWMGLQWNDEVLEFIDKKLWKTRQKMKGVTNG